MFYFIISFNEGTGHDKETQGKPLKSSSKKDGSVKCGPVDHASDPAGFFLQLPLPCTL